MTRILAALLGLAASGCDALGLPPPDLERMIDQPRVEPYERVPFFEDERAMRTPPKGTRPSTPVLARSFTTGREGTEYLTAIPLPLTFARIDRGRRDFDVFCAACHGVLGTGTSQVSENMTLRKPPSLVDEPIRSYPAGRVFQAIALGYGMMPLYETALGPDRGWAVVAYVEALQIRTNVAVERLPDDLRAEALSSLR